jgi:hypothetical protein
MLLVSRGPGMLRILAITRADRTIPHFASLAEALAQVSGGGSNGHRLAGTLAGQALPGDDVSPLAGSAVPEADSGVAVRG